MHAANISFVLFTSTKVMCCVQCQAAAQLLHKHRHAPRQGRNTATPQRRQVPMSMAKRLAFSKLRNISSGGRVMLLSMVWLLVLLSTRPHSAMVGDDLTLRTA